MRTRVQKWGNSLAVRIPKSFAAEMGIAQDSPVEVSLGENGIVVSAVQQPHYSLEELVAGINRRNRHPELETNATRGLEK